MLPKTPESNKKSILRKPIDSAKRQQSVKRIKTPNLSSKREGRMGKSKKDDGEYYMEEYYYEYDDEADD